MNYHVLVSVRTTASPHLSYKYNICQVGVRHSVMFTLKFFLCQQSWGQSVPVANIIIL